MFGLKEDGSKVGIWFDEVEEHELWDAKMGHKMEFVNSIPYVGIESFLGRPFGLVGG